MKLSEYRNSSSWQGAIALGPKLMGLAEELPASEEMGLSLTLRTLMVELPATVAADLLDDHSDMRLMPVLKLLAALELIDQVYPALDTAGVRAEADALAESLMSNKSFKEPKTASPAHEAPKPPVAPAATPVLAAEAPAPAKPEAPAPSAPAPTSVSVVAAATESKETDVHPDSV